MSLSVFNWILVTLSTCSEKILLDPCRVFLEYIEIEQGKKKGSTCMVHILISTLVEHLHVGSIILHYMYITDQIGIFLWGIFHSTLFILWWLPTSLLAWINPPWGRRPNRAGAPIRLAPAAPPPADKQKMEKDKLLTSKWFNNLFANREKQIIVPAISSLATTIDCKTVFFFSFSKSVLQGAMCCLGHAWRMFD